MSAQSCESLVFYSGTITQQQIGCTLQSAAASSRVGAQVHCNRDNQLYSNLFDAVINILYANDHKKKVQEMAHFYYCIFAKGNLTVFFIFYGWSFLKKKHSPMQSF